MKNQKLIEEVLKKYYSIPGSSLTESRYLPLIFEKITDKKDLEILLSLPNNPKAAAKSLNMGEKEVADALNDLYMRGFIWIEETGINGPEYCFADIGIFMDCVLFDPRYDEYGDEFFDIWKKYWNEEHVHMYQPDNVFRVLPIEEVIRGTRVLPYESVSKIFKNASKIAVQRCACRVKERRCNNPLETCISLDDFADYIIKRDIGYEISLEKALKIIEMCEDSGLVHQTINSETPDVICNCCSCCCTFLRSILYYGKKAAAAKSRYMAIFDREKCSTCKEMVCADRCIFGCLSIKDGVLQIDHSMCWGCGLCARACPENAVTMKQVRKPSHIPTTGAKLFSVGPPDK